MKKLIFGLIATVMITGLSFGQEKMTINSSVTSEEYKTLSTDDQRLADYLTSAIALLNALELNGQKYANYDVDIHFSKDEKNIIMNTVILSQNEGVNKSAKGSCQVCGIRSAYKCLDKIKAAFAGQDDYDIHVHNDGNGCVTLSW